MKEEKVLLAHGSGGRMMHELVDRLLVPELRGGYAALGAEDSALVALPGLHGRLAVTTDSYVVSPIFFPGGNIGDLAVNGTVNDLVVSGATPLYITSGLIIEEGLPVSELMEVLRSMKAAADKAGVTLVAGDTKVVNRGKADRLFINTAGIGVLPGGVNISAGGVKPGDMLIVSGSIGEHGMAVMSVREGLEFGMDIVSDTAALNSLVSSMLSVCPEIHAMRDPTRGGLATTLNEFAAASGVCISLNESAVPVREPVRGACEVLGLDPLYVANEGKLVAAVPKEMAGPLVEAMRNHPQGKDAAIIGEALPGPAGKVLLKTSIGGTRIVDMLSGEQLPRIC